MGSPANQVKPGILLISQSFILAAGRHDMPTLAIPGHRPQRLADLDTLTVGHSDDVWPGNALFWSNDKAVLYWELRYLHHKLWLVGAPKNRPV